MISTMAAGIILLSGYTVNPKRQGERNSPRSCTNNSLALVLSLNGVPFEIDVLSYVPNERQDFSDSVVN